MPTVEQLRDAVLDHQFSEDQYAAYIVDMLDEAQKQLAAEVDYRVFFDTESYSTTSNDATYSLPADFVRSYTLEDTDEDSDLAYYPPEEFDNLDHDSTGRPSAYTIDGSEIRLWPTPDGVYALSFRHYRLPATLAVASLSATPEIPAKDHHLLRTYALARCFERENDLRQAEFFQAKFERDKDRAKGQAHHQINDYGQSKQIPGPWNRGTQWVGPRMP